jgi:hypothetical protein
LIGRQGQTLSDLQYLTNRLLFQEDQNVPRPWPPPRKSAAGVMWWRWSR